MRRPLIRTTLLAATLCAALTGCQDSSNDRPAASEPAARNDARAGDRVDTQPATRQTAGAGTSRPAPQTEAPPFTGTLRGDVAAIGGETTGWRLEGDAQTGGIDVDVSKVQARAKQLDGRRVTVTGKMTTRSWPESGETQVLVVEKIEPAPQPQK